VKTLSILYHDVIDRVDYNSSGFPGRTAARYKLAWQEFEEHLQAISDALHSAPVTVFDLQAASGPKPKLLLTFDDGGASAPRIADTLDRRGWPGHFFVTTDYIGRPAFLDASQIRALRQKGHVIGSHSCSHPRCMSSCSSEQLLNEWRRSTEVLTDILGEQVTVASVPGGYYSDRVAQTAAQAGVKFLFTSEPVSRCHTVAGCWVVGRYGIVRGMSARSSADFATGRFLPCFQQWAFWNLKKLLKSIGGDYYDRFREFSLGNRGIPPYDDPQMRDKSYSDSFEYSQSKDPERKL
jgi:peptidoglycan/xylan/chitin deacetylase (PgdA/CDA1 family)